MEFSDLLASLGVVVADDGHHHARQGWVQFDCPHCSPNTSRFGMGYSIERGSLNCWFCGRHRMGDTLIALGVPRGRLKALTGGLRRRTVDVVKLTGTYKPPKGVGPLAPAHRKYLRGRGYDPDQLASLWGLGGITHHSRLPWRIFAPIYHYDKLVSWSTRNTREKGLRWLTASDEESAMPVARLIYGLHYVRHTVVIHEGMSDVWRTGPGSVGVLGIDTNNAQLRTLSKFARRVVCYDNSAEAQKRAKEMARALSVYPGETLNLLLDADDPGSATEAETKKLRAAYLA